MIKTGHFGFVTAAARTDVGKKRKNNEDAFGVFQEAGVFCVADGMGGGDDGEIASAAVVKGLEDGLRALVFREDGGYAAADVADVVEASLTKASAWIFNRTRTKKLSGCGSTFVGFALDATAPGNALAVHAGDSRLYLIHGRSIKQITHDHSVAEMIGAKDESKVNPMFRSMVMNAIGIRPKAEPERTPFKVVPGDRVLVCSDGLSRMVPDKKILAASRKCEDVAKAVDELIAAALEAGGVDNVTAVLVEVGELPAAIPALEPPAEAVGEPSADSPDRTTGATGGDSTDGGTQTMATIMPTMSGDDMLVPEESDDPEDAAEGSAAISPEPPQTPRPRPSRGKLLAVALTAGLLLVVLAALGVLLKRLNKAETVSSTVRTSPSPATAEVSRAVLPVSNPVPKAVSVPAPTVRPVPEVAPVPPPEPPQAKAREPLLPVKSVPAKTDVSQPKEVESVVTNAVVTNAVVTNAQTKVEAFEPVIRACEGDSLALFCQAFRRLEGSASPELNEQMKRFEASARYCARMRTKEGAERAVVDLKYCLEASAGVRKALESSDRAVARKLLVWWDALRESEPSSSNGMMSASRFMAGLQELGGR